MGRGKLKLKLALKLGLGLLMGLALGLSLRWLPLAPLFPALLFPSPLSPAPSLDAPLAGSTDQVTPASVSTTAVAPLQYDRVDLPQATVHLLTIPAALAQSLTVAIAENLQPVAQWAADESVIAVLNAGFFDPENGQTTAYVTIDGELVADPSQNQRLVGNPDLAPYLDKILNRSEFRQLNCGGQIHHAIAFHHALLPANCTLRAAVGAGPQLLPRDTSLEEAFIDINAAGDISRDALGSRSPNARTAVGIRDNGDVLWVVVAQIPGHAGPSGMTLTDLADFLSIQGAAMALNLDGGSSSTLYVDGTLHGGKFDREGNPIQRPVKSVLLLRR